MAIIVKVHGVALLFEEGRWQALRKSDRPLAKTLIPLVRTTARLSDHSGADPYPALSIARYVAKMLGGKVIRYDPPRMDEPPGTVF